jgi:hypothetical protein
MELYVEREGNAEVAHTTFDANRGIGIVIRMVDGEALIKIDGVAEEIIVCDGLPLKVTVYDLPGKEEK